MGYTHYFYPLKKKIPVEQWNKFRRFNEQAIKMAADSGIQIVREFDRPDAPPLIDNRLIAWNGPNEDGDETFYVSRTPLALTGTGYVPPDNDDGTGYFTFCKTARKPYDTVVVACCMAGVYFGVFAEWSSDGRPEDHEEGKKLFEEVLTEMRQEIKECPAHES